MSTEPVPQRLSDADRDAAVAMLRQHFTDGRLDDAEFDERMGTALAARFAADLVPLFVDLPEPRPAASAQTEVPPALPGWTPASSAQPPVPWTPPPTAVAPTATTRGMGMAQALIWPVCIVLLITTGWFWWIFVAIIGSIVLKQLNGTPRKPPPPIGR